MNDTRNLEERLAKSRRETAAPELPGDWQAGVMRDIRALTPSSVVPTYFETAVRQAAIAASIFVVAAGALSLFSGFGETSELYVLVQSAPESLLELALLF